MFILTTITPMSVPKGSSRQYELRHRGESQQVPQHVLWRGRCEQYHQSIF